MQYAMPPCPPVVQLSSIGGLPSYVTTGLNLVFGGGSGSSASKCSGFGTLSVPEVDIFADSSGAFVSRGLCPAHCCCGGALLQLSYQVRLPTAAAQAPVGPGLLQLQPVLLDLFAPLGLPPHFLLAGHPYLCLHQRCVVFVCGIWGRDRPCFQGLPAHSGQVNGAAAHACVLPG